MGRVEGNLGRVDFQKVKSTMVHTTRMTRSCGVGYGCAIMGLHTLGLMTRAQWRLVLDRAICSHIEYGCQYRKLRPSYHELSPFIVILVYWTVGISKLAVVYTLRARQSTCFRRTAGCLLPCPGGRFHRVTVECIWGVSWKSYLGITA